MLNKSKNEMKTVVELFYEESVAELIYENEELDKWKHLNEKYGLNQSNLAREDKSPIPFLYLNQTMQNVMFELCPREYELKNFDLTPIPLEILEAIDLSYREEYFDKIFVYADEKNPDPIVIGITAKEWRPRKQDGYTNWDVIFKTKDEAIRYMQNAGVTGKEPYYNTSEAKRYLIGKWGDMKYTFDELKKMAVERFISTQKTEFEARILDATQGIEKLNSEAKRKFGL